MKSFKSLTQRIRMRTGYVLEIFRLIIIFELITNIAQGQSMNEGFHLLNNGEFKEAKAFFESIIEDDKNNTTALICYGRATGMSGNIAESQQVFTKLLESSPNNTEIQLNMAESYLWDNNAIQAAAIYENILKTDSANFGALLGYSNSLSVQKKYVSAHKFIQKALAQQPNNEQALISQKYIRLGLANYLASSGEEYTKALNIVDKNLEANPLDQESLMLKATVHLLSNDHEKARSIYKNKISNTLEAYKGWAMMEHLMSNDKKALEVALMGIEKLTLQGNGSDLLSMKVQYLKALLWNNELKQAIDFHDDIKQDYENQSLVKLAEAELLIYLSDYYGGATAYQTYLQFDSSSFQANLATADAYHALGMDNQAYQNAFQTLKFYPGQKDVVGFIDGLNEIHAPKIGGEFYVSETSDRSWKTQLAGSSRISLTPLSSIKVGYRNQSLGDPISAEIARINSIELSSNIRINRRLKLDANLSLTKVQSVKNYATTTYDITGTYRLNKTHQLQLSHKRELQDFNKALLDRNITMNHFILRSMSFWKLSGLGFYNEYFNTSLSDGNRRSLLFSSIYKNILNKPLLKVGLNYLNMSFSKHLPEQYFSPSTFHQGEGFVVFEHMETKKLKLGFSSTLAVGYQTTETDQRSTWRADIAITKEIGRFDFQLTGQYNSIAVVNSSGFSFSQLGFSLKYGLLERPVFWGRFR